MKKFFVLYRVPVASMDEWKKNTDPKKMQDQTQKMMSDMETWMAAHAKSFVEKGAPLGKTKSVTTKGVLDTRSDLNYYCIVEAESHEAAAQMFTDNPHVQIPTSWIDVIDMPHMGM